MRISDAEVGVVAVHNLAGLLEDEVGCERWEVKSSKWEMTGVDVGDQHPEACLKSPLSVAFHAACLRIRALPFSHSVLCLDGTECAKTSGSGRQGPKSSIRLLLAIFIHKYEATSLLVLLRITGGVDTEKLVRRRLCNVGFFKWCFCVIVVVGTVITE